MTVNILFMARMVYCSIINLLWSSVSYGTLITYWCHVCCLRFRRDNLIVDGRQMVSLISVHGRGSLSLTYMASFTFLLCQLDSRVSTLVFFMDTECPVARQYSPTPVGLSRFVCSLNLWLIDCVCSYCRHGQVSRARRGEREEVPLQPRDLAPEGGLGSTSGWLQNPCDPESTA